MSRHGGGGLLAGLGGGLVWLVEVGMHDPEIPVVAGVVVLVLCLVARAGRGEPKPTGKRQGRTTDTQDGPFN